MRVLIVSDIHANIAALRSVSEVADAVLFLGDCVTYGPHPSPCIAWVRERATNAVRGNHDHAVGFDADPRCAPAFARLADETRRLHGRTTSDEERAWLRSLPERVRFSLGGARFMAVHAAPSDPLYRYVPPDAPDEVWASETERLDADVLLVGHTHQPFVRRIGDVLVANPGSVGLPKHGDPRAAFATWEDGELHLHRQEYDVEETVRDLASLPLPADVIADLARGIRTGGA